jgi:hypothetical protein
VREIGDAGDLLPIGEAARLAGVTARYLRRLTSHYEEHRTEIDDAIAAGRRHRKAYLVAERGTKGRWLETREHLAQYLERRQHPAVRDG